MSLSSSESSSEISSTLLALSNNLADTVERVGASVVAVNGRTSYGRRGWLRRNSSSSGIHWRPGIIVTSDETIKREEEITVTLPDGRTVPVTILGRDASTDVAVLKLENIEFPVAEIGDAATLKVGHLALALGRGTENGVSASMGVVSAIGDAWRSMSGGSIDRFVRLDLTLYSGFSGGPMVDAAGKVAGMNTSGPRNMALTIPASTVNRVVNQLLSKGRIARGYLGLGMQPVRLPDTLKRALSLASNGGVIVVNVEPNGPADKAGVLIGDVLVAIDGNPVSDTENVQAMLGAETVGKSLKVQLIRGGAPLEITLTVGERPARED
ncbi:trypsin-like peptidase domain-containing protein [Coleofasciculus sp. FACHB-64]|uniref:S1C family serine protease n=1 Tax=Cyanophyceae TaxID=3028117 RepID=UPI0016890914|nr:MULTISPECIES: trypsin-like peptidase domain-containing protein [unclassified Coleofasciculus]MBD1839970.1 trypsin-like peptidase domain-containing protein [Coleofasciculus sp. FACHB-501]MBD2044702.1 trypsin-like peptidase domain-containing protein [Coleofasciculus sp. FACHB-64]